MTRSLQSSRPADRQAEVAPADGEAEVAPADGEAEVLDALPVIAGQAALVRGQPFTRVLAREGGARSALPKVQAAAVAAGGFVAGAAVVGLVRRHQRHSPALARGASAGRTLARRSSRKGGAPPLPQILSSSTFLVDVHLLGIPDSNR